MDYLSNINSFQESNKKSADNFKYKSYHIILGKPEIEQSEDLSNKLKPFLIVGRVLGVLPISGIFKKSCNQLYYYQKSAASITSITIFVVLTINLILGILETVQQPRRNAYEIALSFHTTVQFTWGWLIYLYFLVKAKKFLDLFYHWKKTTIFYGIGDRNLKRDTTIITLLILTSAILENAILHLEYIPSLDSISGETNFNATTDASFLESYYKLSHQHWAQILGYNKMFGLLAFVQHKYMLYVVNYMDIMLAVFSRAIYYKFKMLHKLSYEHLVKPVQKGFLSKSGKMMIKHGWSQVVNDHKLLCDMFQEFEDFFSPLIFGSYAVNIYYICLQLLEGITSNISSKSVVHSIYAPWSFLHIILRVFIVSISAARINTYAHQIRKVLQECPVEFYDAEISRMDKKVTTGPDIGFSGLNMYVVNKRLILKTVSVIFTFEIVLLQGRPVTVC